MKPPPEPKVLGDFAMLTLRRAHTTEKYQAFCVELSDYVISFSRPVEEGSESAQKLVDKLNDLSVESSKDIPRELRIRMRCKGVEFYLKGGDAR